MIALIDVRFLMNAQDREQDREQNACTVRYLPREGEQWTTTVAGNRACEITFPSQDQASEWIKEWIANGGLVFDTVATTSPNASIPDTYVRQAAEAHEMAVVEDTQRDFEAGRLPWQAGQPGEIKVRTWMKLAHESRAECASKFDETELAVCTVCICLLANGEYNDGTDAAERAGGGMARIWGDDARHLIACGDDLGFSTRSCEGCGDTDYGDRFKATALIPISS